MQKGDNGSLKTLLLELIKGYIIVKNKIKSLQRVQLFHVWKISYFNLFNLIFTKVPRRLRE